MSKLGQAFKAFFTVLKADSAGIAEPNKDTPPEPARSEALTLLATLQREARLVDFLMEPLEGYSDDQVAAAVRDIQADSRNVLDRIFALKPLRTEPEGSQLTVPAGFDAGSFKLTGKVAGEAPYTGELMHPGWTASKVKLPTWQGSDDSANIIAPAEVEL